MSEENKNMEDEPKAEGEKLKPAPAGTDREEEILSAPGNPADLIPSTLNLYTLNLQP